MSTILAETYRLCLQIGIGELDAKLGLCVDETVRVSLLGLQADHRQLQADLDELRITTEGMAMGNKRIQRNMLAVLKKLSPGQLDRVYQCLHDPASDPSGAGMRTVLFIATAPLDTLRLQVDKEYKLIRNTIRSQSNKAGLRLADPVMAASFGDMAAAIQEHTPWLVHISSHGDGMGIILANENNKEQRVGQDNLRQLFGLKISPTACLVLNGCLTAFPAQAISTTGIAVLGIDAAIGDNRAIRLAEAFYKYLGSKGDHREAYCLTALQLDTEETDKRGRPEYWINGEKITCG